MEAHVSENYVVIRYDILDSGLDLDGRFGYEIKYCQPGEIASNASDVRHSGRFRQMKSVYDNLVLIQSNVMIELLAAWVQEQNLSGAVNDCIFSKIINMSERTSFYRSPSIDDTGRRMKKKRLVSNGRLCKSRFNPQGEYRKDWQSAPEAMWNTLILHPSRQPIMKILHEINKGFFIIKILGLVLKRDFQKNETPNLKLGGYHVRDGKIVGEFLWLERPLSFPSLFRAVIGVDSRAHLGRWKWADGFYASPSVLVKNLFKEER
jgi:predicted Zn-dependent protease